MKQFYIWLHLTTVLSSIYGQSLPFKISGGTVYQTTIQNDFYKFHHAQYSIFIPDGIQEIKGVFIHQHGCTMEGIGASSAFDVQYQAFARKWQLAVLGPDLYPQANHGCDDWRIPEDGSASALLHALDNFARISNHPELNTAPWLLWGHSGGGYWVLAMLKAYADRIIGAVCYSPAFDPHFAYPPDAAKVPVLIRHAGPDDFNDPGINCRGTALHAFEILRNMKGLVSIAYTPKQNHNLSYIRYMTIPFFESVLNQRLPLNDSKLLRDMDQTKAWLCDTFTTGTVNAFKAASFTGNKESMSWLPDSACAVKFKEYMSTGTVYDVTKPPAPDNLKLTKTKETQLELTWTAEADIESGIRYYNIYKNSQLIVRYPAETDFQGFDTNGDNAVPEIPSVNSYLFTGSEICEGDTMAITTINRFNLESSESILIF